MADYNSSLPVRTETAGDVVSKICDGTTNTQVMEVDATKRASVNVNDAGGDELAINSDGSINVNQISTTVGNDQHLYGTQVDAVPATPYTIVDVTVTALYKFLIKACSFAASGKAKMVLKIGTAGANTAAVGFISTASGVFEFTFPQPIKVAAGDKVQLVVTNEDKSNANVYGFVNGVEVLV